jgi:hypothetical protein
MTITQPESQTRTDAAVDLLTQSALYRDIHKGIRADLFALTEEAGRVDSSCREDRVGLAVHVRSTVELLVTHAAHEDGHVSPVLEVHRPALAQRIASEHEVLEVRMDSLQQLAGEVVDAPGGRVARLGVHELYLDLASFTSDYLAHQDFEERVVGPELEAAIGAEAAFVIHQQIVASIPPAEMMESLALMLPAMNVDDRCELLGGVRAGAPQPVFDAVMSLTRSVLAPVDAAAVVRRLGVR